MSACPYRVDLAQDINMEGAHPLVTLFRLGAFQDLEVNLPGFVIDEISASSSPAGRDRTIWVLADRPVLGGALISFASVKFVGAHGCRLQSSPKTSAAIR